MEEKFFRTFGARNPEILNDMISEFMQQNDCKEVDRSSPTVSCCQGLSQNVWIVVTSTFIKLTKDEKLMGDPQKISEIRDFIERGKKNK